MSQSILITGANGQLGTVLIKALKIRYPTAQIIASDIRPAAAHQGTFEIVDATNIEQIRRVVRAYKVTQIYHLAAILSASGEQDPVRTWNINMQALLNVLEIARHEHIEKVFYPSSIAVFGPDAPLDDTPNDAFLNPLTSYGISKAAGENWTQYYHSRYGVDVRSLRYPGVIGHQSDPGGGTTDYAVSIFHYAIRQQPFSCFLEPDTTLPMIHMDDAIRATLELMEAPAEQIKRRTSYNLAGLSFSPAELAAAIQEIYPNFQIEYAPDFRQGIAAGWPNSIDDSAARADWNWKPQYDLPALTRSMIDNLLLKHQALNTSDQLAA